MFNDEKKTSFYFQDDRVEINTFYLTKTERKIE